MAEIMIVDDDENICSAFKHFLTEDGHTPIIVSSGDQAIAKVRELHPDLVIMDIRMPGTDGLEALEQIRRFDTDTYIVIMTAFGTSQTSIEAMRLGAFDYLTKPFDLNELRAVIRRALEARTLSQGAESRQADKWEKYAIVNLVGKDPQMTEAYKIIGMLTTNDVPPLIVGERGTGKALVAQTIHYNSPRKGEPFVSLDCRSLPESALEAELFGRSESRQLGGPPSTQGKLETAKGGTIFLGEISAMSLPLEARLARYLREGAFERSGELTPIKSDVRIIAASERDLAEDVRDGRFNHELFDLLRVITIGLPPLRQRLDDIPELVDHFVKRYSGELSKTVKGVDDRVMQLFLGHPWPGNVGELENVVKRACVLVRGDVITVDEVGDSLAEGDFPVREETDASLRQAVRSALQQRLVEGKADPDWSPFHEVVGIVEEALAREAITVTNGNQVKAAEILGLNRTTLRKKLKVDK